MKTIVAAVDFSDSTAGVISTASNLAKVFGASLHLVHAIEPEPTYTAYGFTPDEFPAIQVFQEEVRKRANARLEELLGHVTSDVGDVTIHLLDGSPLHAVLNYATEISADLIAVGAHGHGAVASLLLGSVAEGLVRKAALPTLVIPAPHKE
jgi:nucleotide-binding universal stress UspA family protein